jgi:23S rRNA (guanine745-N1)-methyltransferase
VNLLQPQDRRAPFAGDTKAALEARARLLAAGVGNNILDAVVQRASAVINDQGTVLELGSGSGDLLGRLTRGRAMTAVGVDISSAAAAMASRRFSTVTWVVANADRRLPILDHSVSLVLSLHGRRNASECVRVLTQGGALLAGVAAPDDLIELREHIQGAAVERSRADLFLQEHAALFDLEERFLVREQHVLEPEALRDLLSGTYRGARTSVATRVTTLKTINITLSVELLLLRRRGR